MIDILIMVNRFDDLTQYLSGNFFEDCEDLAAKPESLGEEYPHMSHYAIDMYFRLKNYDKCCEILFRHGRLIDALRILKEYHLTSISPVNFLEAAAETQDPMTFASVYRFCLEFVPQFSSTDMGAKY